MTESLSSIYKFLWGRFERWGRRLLVALIAVISGRTRSRELPQAPKRVLLVRLDERVGNLVLMTPMLRSLRDAYPQAEIDVLGNRRGASLLQDHPALQSFLPFEKRAVFSVEGPLFTPRRLRSRRYDLAIDASNPRDPSLTQAVLVALSGARATLGSALAGFSAFFTHPVTPPSTAIHEIDLRLALLSPLTAVVPKRELNLPGPSFVSPEFDALISTRPIVLNVGARLAEKRLRLEEYVNLAVLAQAWAPVVLSWGPGERALAEAVAARSEARPVPETDLDALRSLLLAAPAVVSCDTGPMHISVAQGTPTAGIFVSTDPARFGYADFPHAAVDVRDDRSSLLPTISAWLTRVMSQHSKTQVIGEQ